MSLFYILVIISIVTVFYALIPITGGFYNRYKWRRFRNRFDELRTRPLLDYSQYRQIGNEGGIYRLTGSFESITDGKTLWIKSDTLTVPVDLAMTQCWLFHWRPGFPETPEQIRWYRISTVSEGTKVFIGGKIACRDNRPVFVSSKEMPLVIIFYNCPDEVMTDGIIRAARTRNEYWNNFTPVSLVLGAIALIYIAASFLSRPAFRLTVITALVAVFIPILPAFPPGLLLTVLYRRMTWQARKYRAFWDLARLPIRFLAQGETSASLSNGEKYGFVIKKTISDNIKTIPFLIPEITAKGRITEFHIFGILNDNKDLPVKSKDPFVSFGMLPDPPQKLVTRYAIKACATEIGAWLILLTGIIANIVFIFMIISSLL